MQIYLKCADYRRVSGKKQADNNGDQMQQNTNRSLIEKLIRGGNGEYVGSYQDLAVSAYHKSVSQRQGMQELIRDVENGIVNCIVFYDETRVSRRFVDVIPEFAEPLLKANKNIVFYKSLTGETWDPNSESALSNVIDALVDSNKRAQVARDAQMADIKEKHARPGGRLPYGIVGMAGDQLIPGPTFPIVVLIFELAAWGYSERAIAKYLTGLDIVSAIEKKPEWSHTSVRHILTNQLYIGVGEWNKRPNRRSNSIAEDVQLELFAKYQPLIPQHLWDMAHTVMERRSDNSVTRYDTPFTMIDIIECGHCHSKLQAKNSLKLVENNPLCKQGSAYYYCPNCGLRWDSNEIHKEVFTNLNEHVGCYFSLDQLDAKIHLWKKEVQKHLKDIINDLQNLEMNHSRLLRESKVFNEDDQKYLKFHADAAITDIKEDIANWQDVIRELDKAYDVADLISNRVMSITDSFPRIEQRHIVLSAIDRVVCTRNSKTNESSLEIEYWRIPLPGALMRQSAEKQARYS